MGWEQKTKPPHECKQPNPPSMKRGVGSVWRCRKCGTRWLLVVNHEHPHPDGGRTIHTWQWGELPRNYDF